MCGICGFFRFEDKTLLEKMCDVVKHRGPDEWGVFLDKDVGLGNRRLRIIDLVTGKQPIHNEDENIWITYNGEVYNFPELREELERKGHRFYTRTDTEVLVHAYEEWGDDFVNLLNGMFAFAIWDSNKKRLLLARDRVGIKPLHYTLLGDGTFLFASEIKSILQYEKVKREVDLQSLHYFINLRYVPRERTMFKGIERLLPAHAMVVDKNGIKIKKYWDLKIKPSSKPEEYYVKKLQTLLKNSIRRHMISDIPVGVYLSGGIDSSTIVAFASKMTEEPLKTFCMGFGMETDEVGDARMVAEHFGTDHHEIMVDSYLLKDYPKMIWYADEPKRNLYPYYICELVGKHVKPVQSGLGGDEIFGGYNFKYNFVSRVENIRRSISQNRSLSETAGKLIDFQVKHGNVVDDEHLYYLEMMRYIDDNVQLYLITQTLDKVFDKEYLKKIYSHRLLKERLKPVRDVFWPYFNNDLPFIDQVFLADFSVKMIDDFLLVEDRMSMAHSVEARVPFLDNELVEFSFTIPSHLKLKDPNGKYILKKAMKNMLPQKVIRKEKQGFTASTYQTYVKELREYAMQLLPEGNAVREGYFNREYILKILNELPNPKLRLHYDVIWNLLTFEIWYEIFIKSDNVRRPKLDIKAMC